MPVRANRKADAIRGNIKQKVEGGSPLALRPLSVSGVGVVGGGGWGPRCSFAYLNAMQGIMKTEYFWESDRHCC